VREGSRETSGIQGVYLLKSVILVFAVQMGLQAISVMVKNALTLAGKETKQGIQHG
jgi:TRAP-type mannitol/chloroaromatic compound transport system permease small subunit